MIDNFCLKKLKQHLFFILLLLLTHINYGQVSNNDSININQIKINGLSFHSDVNHMQEIFGEYDSLIRDDMPAVLGLPEDDHYYYDNSSFSFKYDSLTQFNINNKEFVLSPGNIQVGDSLSKIQDVFPKSYKKSEFSEKKKGKVKTGFITVFTYNPSSNGLTDYELTFLIKDRFVKSFKLWKGDL